jgi:hypothetical protein
MKRLFTPTMGPSDWRRLLADPEKQWRPKKSALEMAVCWEAARESERGIPADVERVLDSFDRTRGAELLFAVPEHQVSFAGGGHASQNDLWALLRVGGDIVSLAIEAKAGEKLDDLVDDWLPEKGTSSRKPERLLDLREWLAVGDAELGHIRYQLLHRAASALKEAKRFGAAGALLLVQSFARERDIPSLRDLEAFGELMGAEVAENAIATCGRRTCVPLMLGWVTSEPADVSRLFAAV